MPGSHLLLRNRALSRASNRADFLARFAANGIKLAYQEMGDPGGEPLLLVMGLATQMIAWPDELCDRFVQAGFGVLRYDHRDTGRSSYFDEPGDHADLPGEPLGDQLEDSAIARPQQRHARHEKQGAGA